MTSFSFAVRSWVHSEDRYYWLTSHLATRGLRRSTCRLIAANLLGLGAIPLILMLSPLGPSGTTNRLVAIAVSLCCVAMSAVWLRPSWPTRWQSQSCVALGSICIMAACVIQPHPAIGLVGASAFVSCSAFTALFHDKRMLAFTWTVGAATVIVLAIRMGRIDSSIAMCATILLLSTNVFVVFACRNIIRLVDREFHYGELERLTGLLTREAFADRVATLIAARDRDEDRFMAIVVVSLDSFSLLTSMSGAAGGKQARVAIGHRIAVTLRRDAVLAHVGESEFLIADTFTRADATVLTDRLHHTVSAAPFRLTASIGVVTTPLAPLVGLPPDDVVEELITLATSNVDTARKLGGHRTHASECPRLTVNADDLDGDLSA